MNATICGIVDLLFKDTVDNAETRALREELLNNCLEHYNDLIGRGLTETEAIDAVVESLKGMKEVIDEYPKKQETAEKEEPKQEEKMPDPEPVFENTYADDRDRVFETGMIRKIRSDLRDGDLKVGRSGDGRIHVRCEYPEKIGCEAAGTLLRIFHNNNQQNTRNDPNLKMEDMSLKGILNFVGKAISKGFSNMGSDGTTVYLDLPDGMMDELVFNAMSGNITVNHCAGSQMILHSTSGDIEVYSDPEMKAEKMTAGSASGDITFHGDAVRVEMSSISGDVELEGNCVSARLKSTSGDVDMTGCAQDVVTHTISGDQTIILRNGDASAIDAGSTSGDIEIHVPKTGSGVHAIIQTVSGDKSCAIPDAGSAAGLQIHAKTVSGDVEIM